MRKNPLSFLGHHLDEQLSWTHHSNHIYKKLVSDNFALSRSKGFLSTKIFKSIYQSLFESHLHFGLIVWCSAKQNILNKLDIQQKKAVRHITNLKYYSQTAESFKNLNYLKFYDLISFNRAIFICNFKILNFHGKTTIWGNKD